MRYSRFLAVMFFFLGMQPLALQAAEIQTIRVVAADDNSFANDVAVQLLGMLKASTSTSAMKLERLSPNAIRSSDPESLLVLLGESAVREMTGVDTGRVPLLLAAPQRTVAEWEAAKSGSSLPNYSGIQFEQPLNRMLNLSSLVETTTRRNQGKVVGILASPVLQKKISTLEGAAADRQLKLRIETVESEMAVGPAVAKLVEQSNMILALPDPLVHTANTVQPILLLSYRASVPVIAYSPAYLRAGATLALYSTPEQIARQIAETIGLMRAGKPTLAFQVPRYFTVGANAAVARSLSLELPATSVLEERLRLMKE